MLVFPPFEGLALRNLLIEIAPLAFYVVFVFYAFCAGFRLRQARKVAWGVYFISFSFLSFLAFERYVLEYIIPLTAVLAYALCFFQHRDNQKAAA